MFFSRPKSLLSKHKLFSGCCRLITIHANDSTFYKKWCLKYGNNCELTSKLKVRLGIVERGKLDV